MLLFVDDPTWATDLPVVAILVGLVALVGGAELLVRGAVWIALTVGMSRMAVGLTLVSIGTSLPELLVTLVSAEGQPEAAMANVLGSNVANVLLIVGTTAALRAIHPKTRWFELGFMLLLTALMAFTFLDGGYLARWLSAILLAVLILFISRLMMQEHRNRKQSQEEPPPPATPSGWLVHGVMLAVGLMALSYGASWLVEGASRIAEDFGVSGAVIGVTVFAIGTSLPELATSVVAALRGQPELCIGNVIGSNIFNIGAVLGCSGMLQPFAFQGEQLLPVFLTTAASSLLLVIVLRRLGGVPRSVGVLFLLAYAAFTSYMVVTQTDG